MNSKIKFLSLVLFVFAVMQMMSAQSKGRLELYATVPNAVGNIAFDSNGNLVYSNHPFFAPAIRVMHYNPKTKKSTPYPNASWNTKQTNPNAYLDDVLGIRSDSKGVVWMLDMGTRSKITPKLVGWDTKHNKLVKVYPIPSPASIPTSQLNDFVIDETRGVIVIADEDIANGGDGSKAALVLLDLKTGKSRRVLEGHYSTKPEPVPIMSDGKVLHIPGTTKPILVGADGITLDKQNEWLYYAPLNGTKLYRIRMDDLLHANAETLLKRPEVYASKHNNGGLSIDNSGNLYLTLVGDKAIGLIRANSRKSEILVSSNDMVWPDGVSYNAHDGYMYTGAAQLPLAAVFNSGKDLTVKPYKIYRFRPLVPGVAGR